MHFYPNPVIAHRGAWKALQYPENSIASLKQALLLRCAGSEFDVHMTADEALVINHDDHFHGLEIETHTLEELRRYFLSNGEHLPTLKEYLLQGITHNEGTKMVIEIKPTKVKARGKVVAKKCYDLVDELKASKWITYISFDLDILTALISLNKKVNTQYLNGELSPAVLKSKGITGLDYHYSVFKQHPEWIHEAKENKMVLNTWTVNAAEAMDYFIRHRFDYITTNEPELLFERIILAR
jgi:glycerophosphoryl diester phosphodiesterase